jgi:pimeloyl-ACP methyl ester carboxylesterase
VACSDDSDDDGAATTTGPASSAPPTTGPATTGPDTSGADPTSPAGTDPATTLVPEGDAFYSPPDPLPDGAQPGDLLRSRPFAGPDGAQGWQILYVSEDLDGNRVAVSGAALAPTGPVPAGRRPVLSWANGTVGLGDACTESKKTAAGQPTALTLLGGPALANDWVVVGTDYQGLGTPGVHPYLVGGIAGRNVLDAARAVMQIPETGASDDSPVLVWGHSQGGHSAVFAAELAAEHAPELRVEGAVAGAPPGDLVGLLDQPIEEPVPYFGFLPMMLAGFEAAYGDLDFGELLTAEGEQALVDVSTKCVGEIITSFANADPAVYLQVPLTEAGDVLAGPLEENSAGRPTDIPLFVYHGEADDVVAPSSSETMTQRYCEAGVTIERRTYPGADHTSVIPAAAGDIQAWLRDRLAGAPATSSCP